MDSKATLKVVRARAKRVLIYLMIKNVTPSSLPWTLVANCISKGTIFCSHVPAKDLSTTNYRVHP